MEGVTKRKCKILIDPESSIRESAICWDPFSMFYVYVLCLFTSY